MSILSEMQPHLNRPETCKQWSKGQSNSFRSGIMYTSCIWKFSPFRHPITTSVRVLLENMFISKRIDICFRVIREVHAWIMQITMQVPYRTVEVNPLTKKQLKWSGQKKVPVVLLDNELINDSSLILSRLAIELEDPEPEKTSWFGKSTSKVRSGETVCISYCSAADLAIGRHVPPRPCY